jgi:AraC-like DNA-binding protein
MESDSPAQAEQYWIRANLLAPVADALAEQGQSIHGLLDRHQMTEWKIHNSYQQIPLRDYIAFFEDAAALAQDPFFGLRLGARFRPESFGVIGNVFRSSTDLRSTLARLAVYLGVVRGGTRVEFVVRAEGADWIYQVAKCGLQGRQDVEFSLAATCGFIRALLGPQWAPAAVHFEHAESDAKPGERQILHKVFRAPVLFDQPTNKLVISARDLERAGPQGQNAAAPYMERYFREHVADAQGEECFANHVRYVIARRIGHAALDLGSLASELGLSGRTLQRRLAEEGVSLRSLITEQRTLVAEALLSRKAMHVSVIAQNLGYSDPAVLSRAFKLWKGSSPSAFRKQRRKKPDTAGNA